MLLKNQVCSRELSKKLKDLKVKQESCFYWYNSERLQLLDIDRNREYFNVILPEFRLKYGKDFIYGREYAISDSDLSNFKEANDETEESYSAFTLAELGEMLPENYLSGKSIKDDDGSQYNCWQFDKVWNIVNYNTFRSKTEADARAKTLISLIENNLIDISS